MEIERKFIIKKIPDNVIVEQKKELEQAYISVNPVIRIRKSDDKYKLTIKGKGLLAREEFELTIDKEQYENLKSKVENHFIVKNRYFIKYGEHLIELDEFKGHLKDLLIAEIEFNDLCSANDFTPPSWFGKEVTDDANYQNSSLSKLDSPPR